MDSARAIAAIAALGRPPRPTSAPLNGEEHLVLQKPTSAVLATRPLDAYDRHRWEEALLATKVPHHNALLLGWALAHLAGPSGYLPAGSMPMPRLAARARINPKQTRLSLMQLMAAGLVTRPDIETWEPRDVVRPITLTLPTGRPHPSEAPE